MGGRDGEWPVRVCFGVEDKSFKPVQPGRSRGARDRKLQITGRWAELEMRLTRFVGLCLRGNFGNVHSGNKKSELAPAALTTGTFGTVYTAFLAGRFTIYRAQPTRSRASQGRCSAFCWPQRSATPQATTTSSLKGQQLQRVLSQSPGQRASHFLFPLRAI